MPETSGTLEKIQVVYFSGTGGTRRVAQAFAVDLAARGKTAALTALDASVKAPPLPFDKPDLLILVFALHAFDAPEPVYAWAEKADLQGVRAAVVSVSGGGEHFPNTGCRNRICQTLESRGAAVVYDAMLVMPCNWVFSIKDEMAAHLLAAMPGKVQRILDDVLTSLVKRSKKRLGFARTWISNQEKQGAHEFPKTIRVAEECTSCGLCARGCPTANIAMQGGKPTFGGQCIMCFRCVYGCPAHALRSNNFMVLKKGFDLDALEKRMAGVALPPVEKCFRGLMWKSTRDYLQDKD